jgi:hypothetical protein
VIGRSQTTRYGPIYGLMAEFDEPKALVRAAHAAHTAGYRRVEAYSPYPIEEVSHALGHHRSKMPLLVLGGGITGACAGFGLAYWSSVIAYPMNIAGKPLNSWPAFIVPTFETTILFGALAAVLGMLALNGLPMPYHPVFNVPNFARASKDRYFLCIEARDRKFDLAATRDFLEHTDALEVREVEH